MIFVADPDLKKALDVLRVNPELGPRIREMEQAGLNINIVFAPHFENSKTDSKDPMNHDIFINPKGDSDIAEKKWGIKGTTAENSIVHKCFQFLGLLMAQ